MIRPTFAVIVQRTLARPELSMPSIVGRLELDGSVITLGVSHGAVHAQAGSLAGRFLPDGTPRTLLGLLAERSGLDAAG